MGFDISRLTAWKIQHRKEECAIDKTLEKTTGKKALTRNRPVRGKTRIIVKEHFSQQGKTMDELLTDVLMEKAKQTMP